MCFFYAYSDFFVSKVDYFFHPEFPILIFLKSFSQSWFTCLLQSDGSKLWSVEQSELSYPSTPQSQRSNRWIVLDHLSSNQKTMKDLSTIWQMDTWTYLRNMKATCLFSILLPIDDLDSVLCQNGNAELPLPPGDEEGWTLALGLLHVTNLTVAYLVLDWVPQLQVTLSTAN